MKLKKIIKYILSNQYQNQTSSKSKFLSLSKSKFLSLKFVSLVEFLYLKLLCFEILFVKFVLDLVLLDLKPDFSFYYFLIYLIVLNTKNCDILVSSMFYFKSLTFCLSFRY